MVLPNAIPPGPITHQNGTGVPFDVVVVCTVVVDFKVENSGTVVGTNFAASQHDDNPCHSGGGLVPSRSLCFLERPSR